MSKYNICANPLCTSVHYNSFAVYSCWLRKLVFFPPDSVSLTNFFVISASFSVSYFPANQGIHIKYFPFTGGNYHAPLVAMKIDTDRVSDLQIGQLIHIECRSWFDGVVHDTKEMSGLVRFELMLKQAVQL